MRAVVSLLPGATVQPHVRIAGKDIDLFAIVSDALGGRIRVAFECKNHNRPLAREAVAGSIVDYAPLVLRGDIDKFCLITRAGIVANAHTLFDNPRYQHLTFEELLERLLDIQPLLKNMQMQYTRDSLDEYYVATKCLHVDLAWISEHHSDVYSPFVDLGLECGGEMWATEDLWNKTQQDKKLNPAAVLRYWRSREGRELFARSIDARRGGESAELEPLLMDWIESKSMTPALAILGSYGTGKSSFARHLAHTWALRFERAETRRIPFLIELRNFGSHQTVDGLITHELVNRHGVKRGSYECFQMLNRQGRFLLILDGFDEMKQGMTADVLAYNFAELNKLCTQGSKVVLCGRPTVFASESEQSEILSGVHGGGSETAVRYIQINLAPFSEDDSLTFMRRYVSVHGGDRKDQLTAMIGTLQSRLEKSSDLQQLLSRPVHLPMLVTVLPEVENEISSLRRAKLYDLFISKTIGREMAKSTFHGSTVAEYDVRTRRQFARALAVQMFRQGESRTIHYADIPNDLIERFRRPGHSLESTKRDLLLACFLERKPPDILFFGHKSFAEYLVAEQIAESIRTRDDRFPIPEIGPSAEVMSFLMEMLSAEEWAKAATEPIRNIAILRAAIRHAMHKTPNAYEVSTDAFIDGVTSAEVATAWRHLGRSLPSMFVYSYMELLEGQDWKTLDGEIAGFIRWCVSEATDLVAVHAFRVLEKRRLIDELELGSVIGTGPLNEWRSKGWLRSKS